MSMFVSESINLQQIKVYTKILWCEPFKMRTKKHVILLLWIILEGLADGLGDRVLVKDI